MTTLVLTRYKNKPPVQVLVDEDDVQRVASISWWINSFGYVVGRVNGKETYLHRFVFTCPSGLVVDHINGDKLDNRKENLRSCTIKENIRNSGISKNNSSGCSGVSFIKSRNKYRAYITVDRKQINLGRFLTLEAAISARKTAEKQYFKEFARS